MVTADGMLRVRNQGQLVAEIPNRALTDEAPVYHRPIERPSYLADVQRLAHRPEHLAQPRRLRRGDPECPDELLFALESASAETLAVFSMPGQVSELVVPVRVTCFSSPGCIVPKWQVSTPDAGPSEDAVALDNFSDTVLYTNAGSVQPDLSQASPPISVLFANNNIYNSLWSSSTADPVSAVLLHDHIMNEYVLDVGTNSGTDWVVTMPTKRFYVANGTGTPSALFQRNFNKTDGACDDVDLNIYDREENTTSTPLDFSPPPPSQSNALCWEANVVTFNNSNVLGSSNVANIPTSFENGWLDIGFFPTTVTAPIHTLVNDATIVTDINANSTVGPATYVGLPVVGFAVQTFSNNILTVGDRINILSNYGSSFVQKGTRRIDAAAPTPPAP